MNSFQSISIKKTFPFLLLGLFAFFLYLYYVGIEVILSSLKKVNLIPYSSAFLTLLSGLLLYSMAWKLFLNQLSVDASYTQSFLFVLVSSFIDVLVPAESISGDVSKIYLMSRYADGETGRIIASVVSHRVLSMMIVLCGLIAGSISFVLWQELPLPILNLLSIMIVGTLLSISVILLVLLKGGRIMEKTIDIVLHIISFIFGNRWDLSVLKLRIQKTVEAFHVGISVLKEKPMNLISPIFLTILSWISTLTTSLIVFVSLDHSISLSALVIVYSISGAVQSIPLGIPGEVGLTEIVMSSFYSLLGVPIDVAAAATVLISIVSTWFKLLIGYLATQWLGIGSLADTWIKKHNSA